MENLADGKNSLRQNKWVISNLAGVIPEDSRVQGFKPALARLDMYSWHDCIECCARSFYTTDRKARSGPGGSSEMLKNYKDLKVWQRSYRLCLEIYRITAKFPKEERYGLTSLIRRSVASIFLI